MNIKKEKELYKQMDLLQMKEISTYRQQKNGTRIFQLPIKMYGQYIEVGSFKSGYVRRMNGGYTPYQLNKTEKFDHYYKMYDYSNDNSPKFNGNYRKHECVRRILIPNEVDRLEYLITFCLKNYYINQANMIENGKFISKWKHEYEMKNGDIDKVRELQSENRRLHNIYLKQTQEIRELQEKVMKQEKIIKEFLEEIDRISEEKDNMEQERYAAKGALDNLSVIVNNQKYKII
jgi:hypothetical protein